jgi:allantoin racemase
MRILYLMPNNMSTTPEGKRTLQEREAYLGRWAAPGTEARVFDVPGAPEAIETTADEYAAVSPTLQRVGDLLAKDRWEAIILGCYSDLGVDVLRESLAIPVIGPGETSMLLAASLSRRFTILVSSEAAIPGTDRQVRLLGMEGRLASIRSLEMPVLEIRKDPAGCIRAVLAAGRETMRQDRAEAIILGCMSMGFLDVAEAVAPELGIPVLNPVVTSLKFAELLVGAKLTHFRSGPAVAASLS